MTTGRLPSAEKQKQIKTIAAAGWPAAKISETLKVAMPTVQRVLSQNTLSASAGKGEERAFAALKPQEPMRAPQNHTPSAQAEGGIDQKLSEIPWSAVDPATPSFGIGLGYAAKSKNNTSSAQAEGGIGQLALDTPAISADPAKTHSKRVNVTAKLRARVIKLLDLGETDFFIEVATGLNSDQLNRIKKEYLFGAS